MTRRFGGPMVGPMAGPMAGALGPMAANAAPGPSHGPPPLPPPPVDSRHMQRTLKSRAGCESRSTSSGATYEGGELCQAVGGGVGGGGGGSGIADHAAFAPDPPPQPLPLPQQLPHPHSHPQSHLQSLPRRNMYVYQQTTVPFYEESGSGGPRIRPVARACSNASLSGASSCSARCEAFSNFCYYFFQVVLSVGLLGGISLLIAVCVLRGQAWNRDLSSLPYIGFVLVVVCSGLLVVQINAHRSKHRRKVNTRPGGAIGTLGRPTGDAIPLQRIGGAGVPLAAAPVGGVGVGPGAAIRAPPGLAPVTAPPVELMYQPLLPPGRTTLPRHLIDQDRMVGAGGPPWWRRNGGQNDRVGPR